LQFSVAESLAWPTFDGDGDLTWLPPAGIRSTSPSRGRNAKLTTASSTRIVRVCVPTGSNGNPLIDFDADNLDPFRSDYQGAHIDRNDGGPSSRWPRPVCPQFGMSLGRPRQRRRPTRWPRLYDASISFTDVLQRWRCFHSGLASACPATGPPWPGVTMTATVTWASRGLRIGSAQRRFFAASIATTGAFSLDVAAPSIRSGTAL